MSGSAFKRQTDRDTDINLDKQILVDPQIEKNQTKPDKKRADKNSMVEKKSTKTPLIIAILYTVISGIVSFYYFFTLKLDELSSYGQFLGAIFTMLALGWIIAGYWAQQLELRAQFDELLLQRKTLQATSSIHRQQIILSISRGVAESLEGKARRLYMSVNNMVPDDSSLTRTYLNEIVSSVNFIQSFHAKIQSGGVATLIYAEGFVEEFDRFDREISKVSDFDTELPVIADLLNDGDLRAAYRKIKMCLETLNRDELRLGIGME